MMNWLYYLLEANLYLSIFYLAYCLFLKRETFYMFNRVYLIATCMVSFVIPVVQLGILKPAIPAVQNLVLTFPSNYVQGTMPIHTITADARFNLDDALLYIYLLGVVTLMVIFTIKIYQVFKIIHAKPVVTGDQYKLIYINESNVAFSFLNYLFIGANTPGAETIIRHEMVHIRQKHSFDIILLEIVKIISWFNPLVYLLQNSLRNIHEYIADEKTASYETDAITYSTFLVNNAYGIGGFSITHSFFNYNLLKKRISMLNQKRSGPLARLKYLVTVPVCGGLLFISTLAFSKTYGLIDLMPKKADTVLQAPPPPPEPPSLKHIVKFRLPSPFATITKKGYRYAESGYLVDGKRYFRVIIQESKNVQKEYWKNMVSSAQVKMLRDKYGYTFPTMPLYPKLPPPPPMPNAPKNTVNKPILPPPPVQQVGIQIQSNKVSAIKPAKVDTNTKSVPDSFYKQLGRTTRYPADAFNNEYGGRVVLTFTVDAEKKVQNVKILRGPLQSINNEAARALQASNPSGLMQGVQYLITVSFVLIDKNGNYVGHDPSLTHTKDHRTDNNVDLILEPVQQLNEVVIAGYK